MEDTDIVVGTDIGTLGAKSMTVNMRGEILSTSYAEYDFLTPKPFWAEQWPEVWVSGAFATIRDALSQIKDTAAVRGICVSGLYGGSGIPCDRQFKPIRPCLIWMDRRATEEAQWVRKAIGDDTIFRITGNTVDTYYGFTKILWIKNNEPDHWKRIHQLITPNAYAIFRLTGQSSIDYSSAGNLGGLYDIHKRDWSLPMMDEMGIPREFFPEQIVASTTIVGEVTSGAARATGLPKGTPVCAGGVDAPVSALSVGVHSMGQHAAMIGTSMCWNTIQEHEVMRLTPELISYPHVIDPLNRIYTFGGAATAGGIIHWFRANLARLELTQQLQGGSNAYHTLDGLSEKISPGCEGIIVLPYFMGERTPIWNPWARGVILGLTLYHTYAHLYRAFLEGVAFALRHNMDAAKKLGVPLDEEMRLVGGGGRSPLWRQIFADVTAFPIRHLVEGGDAPYGDAFLAALGTKAISKFEHIDKWLPTGERITPRSVNRSVYDQYYRLYLALYQQLRPIFDGLQALEGRA